MSNPTLPNQRMIALAAEVAEASDKHVPGLLLRLEEILDSVTPGTRYAGQVKQDIWEFELLSVMVLAIKQDFSRVSGSWETAARLATLLSNCCTGIDPPDRDKFNDVILPDAAENLLILAKRVQDRYIKAQDSKGTYFTADDLLGHFRAVIDSVVMIYNVHTFIVGNVLRSAWLLQLLITDDKETAISLTNLIMRLARADRAVISTLDEKQSNGILDELVYKLSISEDPDIASCSIRCLLALCDLYPPTIEALCRRYKGLRLLISKWTGKGFAKDLQALLFLLDAGNAQRAEMEKFHRAAIRIQALWRMFNTRRKLQKVNSVFKKFHKEYRLRREVSSREKQQEKQQLELRHQLMMARKRKVRELRERQLEYMEILPAADVDDYIRREEDRSATKLQASWRGYRERKLLGDRKERAVRIKATVAIQRQVRKWLARREAKKKEPPAFQRPPGLTDERRVELQQYIQQHREDHPCEIKSREEQEKIHERAQMMLQRFMMTSKHTRVKHQEREAMLARIENDSELLLNAPKLDEATEKDLELYVCRSVPIANRAQMLHNNEMKRLKQPWWRKLGDEFHQQPELEQHEILF
ncbi:IQ calmodulin-binding motif-containing protein 1-like [Tubulanus polymorphus]|uniref:IQ calmodulin-binding motif-containing protein 1-like n=1 Tax=Tubulanus polymorphus TaxID=672921 RepID=UPI003DA64823